MEYKTFKPEQVKRLIDSKESEHIIDCILGVELEAIPIGEGGNAEVYVPKEKSFEKICIKKAKEKPLIVYNTIDDECKIQQDVKNLGVRTPLTLLSFTTKDGECYFIMERIDGSSIKQIIENPSLLPEKFNYQIFCKELDEQISKMHNKGKTADGIYHRDLHTGNVMINDDGLPVIIDFGTAVKGSGSNFTYEESVEMYNLQKKRYDFVNGYFKDDLKMVQNIKAELKVFAK